MNAQVDSATNTSIAQMPSSNRFLVNTPAEVRFMEMASIETGCKAFLGDPEKYDVQVGSTIISTQIKLRDSVAMIEALVDDPTRNNVLKHEAAGVVANRMIEQLGKAKEKIDTRAGELAEAGQDHVNQRFAPKLERGSLDSEIRGWIREQVKTPEGMNKVKSAANGSVEVASIIYHSPSFLLGLEENVHASMQMKMIERHLPQAYKMLVDSGELTKLSANYDKAISSVRKSFYSPAIASQASRRVNI